MASALTWLDYNAADAERMRQVLAAFDEKETVDSLGLGVIRDALADQLFPGVSTIQTRARYFLFVPWICRTLEGERVAGKEFRGRLRELEVSLIESLRAVEPFNVGVIGYRARSSVQRLPSGIYWNGLGEFGIRMLDLTLAQYAGVAAELGWSRAHVTRNDDGDAVGGVRRMWDPLLPEPPEGFPDSPIGLTMSPEEAEYLADKIAKPPIPSLFSELARDLTVDLDRDFPWDLAIPGLNPRVAEVLVHARNFSELMYGAQVLYNILLARRAGELTDHDASELRDQQVAEFEAWAAEIDDRRDELAEWLAGEDFWLVANPKGSLPIKSRRFVEAWADLALSGASALVDSGDAAGLIVERERSLKGKLARLSERRPLENWNGEPLGAAQLSFRWPNARRLLSDMANPGEP